MSFFESLKKKAFHAEQIEVEKMTEPLFYFYEASSVYDVRLYINLPPAPTFLHCITLPHYVITIFYSCDPNLCFFFWVVIIVVS